jgi:hypothetical protein
MGKYIQIMIVARHFLRLPFFDNWQGHNLILRGEVAYAPLFRTVTA